MPWIAIALACMSAAIGCNGGSPTAPREGSAVIVAFGDSLTSGPGLRPEQTYPALLQEKVLSEGRNYRVVNAGLSGDTSTEALDRFDRVLVPGVKIVIIAIGANDGLRGVPVATVERNIATMIERAQARRAAVLLCQMDAPPIGGLTYTIEFHRVYTRLAERYNVTLVPFFLLGILGNENLDLDDSLHPNAAGHRVIADTIWPHLRPML
ncbi:MAG TPA: arylesterase [Vicinamibacterales bacterium]|nr:arylesterase [Vicinamibacterales bacterium]